MEKKAYFSREKFLELSKDPDAPTYVWAMKYDGYEVYISPLRNLGTICGTVVCVYPQWCVFK